MSEVCIQISDKKPHSRAEATGKSSSFVHGFAHPEVPHAQGTFGSIPRKGEKRAPALAHDAGSNPPRTETTGVSTAIAKSVPKPPDV